MIILLLIIAKSLLYLCNIWRPFRAIFDSFQEIDGVIMRIIVPKAGRMLLSPSLELTPVSTLTELACA